MDAMARLDRLLSNPPLPEEPVFKVLREVMQASNIPSTAEVQTLALQWTISADIDGPNEGEGMDDPVEAQVETNVAVAVDSGPARWRKILMELFSTLGGV